LSFGDMMDHYMNTEDTKEPQSGPCEWLHQPICFRCHSRLSAASKGAVCGRRLKDKFGMVTICGVVNRIEGS
jgi:hypothetical protein